MISLPEDSLNDRVLGLCYRVNILKIGNSGQEGVRRTEAFEAPSRKRARVSSRQASSSNAVAELAASDGEQSSTKSSSESSSSSSTSDKKRKKKKHRKSRNSSKKTRKAERAKKAKALEKERQKQKRKEDKLDEGIKQKATKNLDKVKAMKKELTDLLRDPTCRGLGDSVVGPIKDHLESVAAMVTDLLKHKL